jgi:endonuclease YncB( thermonuclease family)
MLRFAAALCLLLAAPALAEPLDRARIEIVDGDTIRVDGEKVRLVGFDAPETGDDTARCDEERAWGERAKARLEELLESGEIDIRYRKHRDRYRRLLARLSVNGENVGATLIRERLAVKYRGSGPKMDWCPRRRR